MKVFRIDRVARTLHEYSKLLGKNRGKWVPRIERREPWSFGVMSSINLIRKAVYNI